MPNYKLIYFDGRGRAELIRLIFAAANEKFEDFRVTVLEWPNLKPGTPWGTMPILEVDGRRLAQSGAIARYLAKQFFLGGSDKWEQALVDSVTDATGDLLTAAITVGESKARDLERAEAIRRFKETIIPTTLNYFDRFIVEHGNNGFTVGNHMTVADLAIFNVVDGLLHHGVLNAESLDHYVGVKTIYTHVKAHPRISLYLKTRPYSNF